MLGLGFGSPARVSVKFLRVVIFRCSGRVRLSEHFSARGGVRAPRSIRIWWKTQRPVRIQDSSRSIVRFRSGVQVKASSRCGPRESVRFSSRDMCSLRFGLRGSVWGVLRNRIQGKFLLTQEVLEVG